MESRYTDICSDIEVLRSNVDVMFYDNGR